MIMRFSPNGSHKTSFWRYKHIAEIRRVYYVRKDYFLHIPHSGIQKALQKTFTLSLLAATAARLPIARQDHGCQLNSVALSFLYCKRQRAEATYMPKT